MVDDLATGYEHSRYFSAEKTGSPKHKAQNIRGLFAIYLSYNHRTTVSHLFPQLRWMGPGTILSNKADTMGFSMNHECFELPEIMLEVAQIERQHKCKFTLL